MITLRIVPDGTLLGLWTDAVRWTELGPVKVRRASHVEFDEALQRWCVRGAQPAGVRLRQPSAVFVGLAS